MFKYVSYITRTDPATGEMTLPEGKRKIFLSYKHSDEQVLPLCQKLAEYILDKLDVAIWYDRNLTAGEDYDNEIKNAIIGSDVFILLLTPDILESGYVLEREIPLAKKNQIAIIPVIAGLSQNDIPKIEKITGRVHMPVWFFGKQTNAPPFSSEAREQFFGGLQLSIASKDLIEQAKLFYNKGSHNISLRHLTPEQMFVMAYGYLFGVCKGADKSIGIKLMDSILNMYGNDKEFADLQNQAEYELITHLYRVNQPELFFPYLESAISKDNKLLYPLLFKIYKDQWHPEFLCNNHNLSIALFENRYKNCFLKEWDADEVISTAEEFELKVSAAPDKKSPHVGELNFNGHTAYFQKSPEDSLTVNLIIDSQIVDSFYVAASCGDCHFLYTAYNTDRKVLLLLYSDFDHYGPETITQCRIYKFENDKIKGYKSVSEWNKGRRELPYTPFTFNIN